MRVLVIGCGYLGSVAAAELARQGHQVYGMRRSATALKELRSAGIEPLVADITQPESLAKLPCSYDWVVHCVSASTSAVEEYRRIYVEGTRNILAWLERSPPRQFVYTSSTSVYGQTDGSVVEELSLAEPKAETAKILLEAERLLLEAAGNASFPAMILRAAGIYGPERGYWLKQFIEGKASIEGRGERVLNMVHRDDVAGAIIAALRGGVCGEIYNVVDNEPVTQLALFEWLAKKLGRELSPVSTDGLDALRKRGATNKRVSNQKLKTQLGYRFKYPTFREGFAAELNRANR